METNAMEVKNLSFSYGSNQILSDISLTIPRGKITTIMGANGCGKSTVFSYDQESDTGKRENPAGRKEHKKIFAQRICKKSVDRTPA